MAASKLFQPLKIGNITLQHRIAMAPLTRYRADDSHVPLPLVKTYYEQRASTPGTLLITEATFISPEASGYANVPGLWSPEQLAAWKTVTDAVHAKGSYIFVQLWALGRAAQADVLQREFGLKVKSSSDVAISPDHAVPEPLTEEEIQTYIKQYAAAAKAAVEVAGFDGVEIHGANGYLIDQFLQDTANKRTDRWGGSVENRSRFAVEVAKAVTAAVGPSRTGIRFSPYSPFQAMRMADPVPQFSHVIGEVKALDLAYIHLVESRISGNTESGNSESLDWAFAAWGHDRPVLVAGGFKPETAKKEVESAPPNKVVVFGRYFISNPDLVFKLRYDLPLTDYDRSLFYNAKQEHGYIDWPFSKEFLAEN